jgi:hypothetical protein
MRLILLLISFSFLLVSCGDDAPARPYTDVCIVNAPAKNRKCYNLNTDYDSDGNLKKTAKPVYHDNATIDDLNKATVLDSPYQPGEEFHFENGLERMKVYIRKLRAWINEKKKSS